MSLISRFYLHCKFKYISSDRVRKKTLKFVYTDLLKNKNKTKNKKQKRSLFIVCFAKWTSYWFNSTNYSGLNSLLGPIGIGQANWRLKIGLRSWLIDSLFFFPSVWLSFLVEDHSPWKLSSNKHGCWKTRIIILFSSSHEKWDVVKN